MHRLFTLLIAAPLIAAASAPVQPLAPPLDRALTQALAEQRAAQAAADRMHQAADGARDEAGRLAAQQVAAAEALAAAEAGITAADARLRLAFATISAHRARLAEAQRPAAALLAGLVLMARRPPLLALADHGSAEELVRVRLLIAATVPAIRARTAGLARQLAQGRRLAATVAAARTQLTDSRHDLQIRRKQFAQLERKALERAAAVGSHSLSASDSALAAGEDIARLRAEQPDARNAFALAAELAGEPLAPPRPFADEDPAPRAPFRYLLPAAATVSDGLGAVNNSGVRARGLTLATGRGAALVTPAAGTVRYTGPFREYDGVIIIDHGRGWLSLIVNASATVARGSRVVPGQPLGRALGPIQVELSHDGMLVSPALIAGSSERMSNSAKGG